MSGGEDRSWMDNRRLPGKRGITNEFIEGLKHFIEFARSHPLCVPEDKIKCPCLKCRNRYFHNDGYVKKHLMQNGFIDGYKRWIFHGEPVITETNLHGSRSHQFAPVPPSPAVPINVEEETSLGMDDMIRDAAGHNFDWTPNPEEEPHPDARKFIRMMESSKEKLYPGAELSTLEAIAELLNIKADSNMSQHTYNRLTSLIKRMLPKENNMAANFYDTKKLVGHIGLGYEKIDVCKNQCMLFYKETVGLQSCSLCGQSRYKPRRRGSAKHKSNVPYKQLRYMSLIARLLRLYASKSCSKAMRWHKESPREEGVLTHPSDGEAWKQFDATYPDFAADARNIRLGICSDGFTPFGPGAKPYSCWPVIVTVYNLPPWLCMTDPYMYLSLFIPGPKSPGKNIDIYLRPLIDELKQLWTDGVQAWDAFKLENFNMRAAVMWTINDFPAYGMMSGWSTHGRLACPCCMENTKAFTLHNSKKQSWFDCHRQFLPMNHPFRKQKNAFRKNTVENGHSPSLLSGEEVLEEVSRLPAVRWGKKFRKDRIQGFGKTHNWTKKSIFWELPYWKSNLVRHNLDVMHIEKNIFENVFNTLMDFKSSTKDTPKGRLDVELYCSRDCLNLRDVNGKPVKPVASFVLSKEDRNRVLQWLKNLKLPNSYASNIGNCVNVEDGSVIGLKSHDCHVLLNRLLPIALRDLLPNDIWEALTELSEFFRALTSSTLRVDDMKKLQESIVVTICKLEKIFPPSFFDSMEHLPVHLAYEARVGGPVQYRWMYPFERFLGRLKKKMSNRAKVEASICEAVIIDEIASYVSTYFHSDIETRFTRVGRNYDGGVTDKGGKLSVFSLQGRFLKSKVRKRMLSRKEWEAATLYVLLNCPEVEDYLNIFEDQVRDMPVELISLRTDTEFPTWLKTYISNHREDLKAARLEVLLEPLFQVKVHNGYFVNGYLFHTKDHGKTKSTWNCGVNLKGNFEYYGILEEVVELRYFGGNSVVLFNCAWRDSQQGILKHKKFDLVDLKHSSKHPGDDTFILASQAQQVYMTEYPCRRSEFKGLWAVWKTKARSTYDIPYSSSKNSSLDGCLQEEEMPMPPNASADDHDQDDAFMDENPNRQTEEVLPSDLPPPQQQGQLSIIELINDSEEEEEEEDYESESEEEEEEEEEEEDYKSESDDEEDEALEFCSEDDSDSEMEENVSGSDSDNI